MSAGLLIGGCTSVTMPWEPSASEIRASQQVTRSVVAIGPFADPPVVVAGVDKIGSGMAQMLRERLAQQQNLHVQYDPPLVSEVQHVLMGPGSRFGDSLRRLSLQYPGVQYVVVGRVVEFKHAALAPQDLSSWSAARHRHQAQAIIKVDVVDLRRRAIASSQTLQAQVWAGEEPMSEVYQGMQFGTHRFWDTPLGLASRDVINQCVRQVAHLAPQQHDEPIRVVDRLTDRRIQLASVATSRVVAGDVLYVCAYDATGVNLRAVHDPVTCQPLRAKIEPRMSYAPLSAWLMGEPPAGIKVRETVLVRTLPADLLSIAR